MVEMAQVLALAHLGLGLAHLGLGLGLALDLVLVLGQASHRPLRSLAGTSSGQHQALQEAGGAGLRTPACLARDKDTLLN